MVFIEVIILGIIQGLTEFIPVSSSGHLVIAQTILSGASDHLFLEFINLGTVLALIIYFRKRIWTIITDVLVKKNWRLARNILLTALPAGLVGFALADFIEKTSFFSSLIVVVCTLIIVGIIMIVLEKLPKASAVPNGEALTKGRAFAIGLAQVCALIPGVSRSGSTIIAGRLLGLSPAQAAEYSFLASLPIMLGVSAKVFLKSSDRAYLMEHLPMLLIGNLLAFVAGILAIGFLLRYLAKHDLKLFGWYRIGLALVVIIGMLLIQ